tara:strand:+ start:343 stop:741 length:399 start_codon:yes stop_codon:yes gene_type:complete
MENKKQAIFVGVILSFLLVTMYFFWPTLTKQFEKKEIILVTIKLDNRCSLFEEAFIVVHEDTNRTTTFNNGLATINVREGSDLTLALSPRYPDFRYDGIPQPAKAKMTMIADCSKSPRMQMIMDSMNESFKN